MEKLDMQSPNLVSQNIANIAALFPNCVTEGSDGKVIDFDLLRQELSDEIVEGNKERYRLEWPGKREAIVTANLPTNKTLRPIRADSVNFDTTENIYIEGDNLEVLKVLQESYLGKIKMIYIDPPYNTGKDFVYKDNFSKTAEDELFESGQKDEYNQRLIANPETAGRYHSDWLSMMYPRLKLARNLLTDDGVIFISIDDNEVHNLRKVCDEVFGENNFVAKIIWRKKAGGGNDSNDIAVEHEYILSYSKSIKKINKLPLKKETIKNYKYKDEKYHVNGPYSLKNLNDPSLGDSSGLHFDIECPDGSKLQGSENQWKCNGLTYEKRLKDDRIEFKKQKGEWKVYYKIYLNEEKGVLRYDSKGNITQKGRNCSSILFDVALNKVGNDELKILFDSQKPFDYPKPSKLIQLLITLGSDPEDTILDFFSGSASSADAVLHLNSINFQKRKFIQVQIPETTDNKSDAHKAGYKNICEIGKERIRRAGKKVIKEQQSTIVDTKVALKKFINTALIKDNGQWTLPNDILVDEEVENLLDDLNGLQSALDSLDTGFRVYRLDSSNMKDVYYEPQKYTQTLLDNLYNSVKEDRTADDLLAQIMLDWGLPLSLNIQRTTIEEKEVFKVAGNSLYACFDKGVDEGFAKAIAKEKPLRIVFKDSSFKDDTAKMNVQQLLKQLSSNTEMKVI